MGLVPATALIDRALELNANFARGWFWSGWVRLYAGDFETATRHFETSMRLSPRDRWAIHLTGLGIADFFGRRFDRAVAKLRASLGARNDISFSCRELCAHGQARRRAADRAATAHIDASSYANPDQFPQA